MATVRSQLLPLRSAAETKLEVVVLYTGIDATLAGLRTAGRLAKDLHASIRILVPQIVPYPLALDAPAVCPSVTERHVRTIASGSSIETTIDVRLCRDEWDAIRSGLHPGTLVVMPGKRSWWPTRSGRLARELIAQGHDVVFSHN